MWAEPPWGLRRARPRAPCAGARRPAEGRAGGLRPPPGAGGRGSRLRPGRRAVVCAGDPRLPRGSQSPGRVRPRSPVGAVSTLHGRPEPTHGKSRVSGRGRSCHGVSILTTTDAAAVGPEDGATGRPGPRGLGSKVGAGAAPRPQRTASLGWRASLRPPRETRSVRARGLPAAVGVLGFPRGALAPVGDSAPWGRADAPCASPGRPGGAPLRAVPGPGALRGAGLPALSAASCFALVETLRELSGACGFLESPVRGPWRRFQPKGVCPLGSAGTNQCAQKAGASGTGISPGRAPSCPPTYAPRPIRAWEEAAETQTRSRPRGAAGARVSAPRSEAAGHFVDERSELGLRAVARVGLREKCHLVGETLGHSTAGSFSSPASAPERHPVRSASCANSSRKPGNLLTVSGMWRCAVLSFLISQGQEK